MREENTNGWHKLFAVSMIIAFSAMVATALMILFCLLGHPTAASVCLWYVFISSIAYPILAMVVVVHDYTCEKE